MFVEVVRFQFDSKSIISMEKFFLKSIFFLMLETISMYGEIKHLYVSGMWHVILNDETLVHSRIYFVLFIYFFYITRRRS